jgi:peptidoglycan/xylan/chitin deacetylase (PgdA/CDA1 family)
MSILCYHAVDPAWESPLALPPPLFAAHVEWLASRRRVVPAERAAAAMSRRGALPRGMAALTFDDGYAGLHDHALPVLSRLRVPATVFVVAATLTENKTVDWVDDPPAHELRTLDREQIREMQDAGVAFGSHSLEHRDLTELTYAACVEDLKTSRAVLEGILGGPVRMLAYPRGRHDESVRRAAAEAGYEVAFSLPERREPVTPFSVPRAGIYRGNRLGVLRVKSARYYVPLRSAISSYRRS